MRTMTLLWCLRLAALGLAAAELAGCAGANADLAASVSEPIAAAPAASSAPSRTAANSHAGKPKRGDAKNDDARKDTKDDDWWKEGGVTREKVSAMCWMKYEKGRKDLPIDKRADLVNACVDQTLAQHPLR